MKIHVGSKNPVKIRAVQETCSEYPFLAEAEVIGVEVESGVSEQPKSIQETIQGAKNRALNSFKDCDYSIGHESGLIKIPETKTGYMNIDFCIIYDGKDFHIGSSPLFEYPIEVIKLVLEHGLDISEAFLKAGLTQDEKIGVSVGAIGILTKGRLNRTDYTKHATRMALIHLENLELYKKD